MIVIEARNTFCLFEPSPVMIKTTSLAIHEEMCPEVLDDVDEIIIELWLVVSNLSMLAVKIVINVWCKLL